MQVRALTLTRFCANIINQQIVISAEDYPLFLYPDDQYNSDTIEEELLQSSLLLSVHTHKPLNDATATRTFIYRFSALFLLAQILL